MLSQCFDTVSQDKGDLCSACGVSRPNAGQAMPSSSSSSGSLEEEQPDEDAGSASGGKPNKSFKPPRKRPLPVGSQATSLEDRVLAGQLKSTAAEQERQAMLTAEKAAKKARTQSMTKSSGRGRSKGKQVGAEEVAMSLDDFPSGDL